MFSCRSWSVYIFCLVVFEEFFIFLVDIAIFLQCFYFLIATVLILQISYKFVNSFFIYLRHMFLVVL